MFGLGGGDNGLQVRGPLKVQSNALNYRSHDTRHGGLLGKGEVAAETPPTQIVRAESTEGMERVEGGSPGVLGVP